jgi:hypothetical protein
MIPISIAWICLCVLINALYGYIFYDIGFWPGAVMCAVGLACGILYLIITLVS